MKGQKYRDLTLQTVISLLYIITDCLLSERLLSAALSHDSLHDIEIQIEMNNCKWRTFLEITSVFSGQQLRMIYSLDRLLRQCEWSASQNAAAADWDSFSREFKFTNTIIADETDLTQEVAQQSKALDCVSTPETEYRRARVRGMGGRRKRSEPVPPKNWLIDTAAEGGWSVANTLLFPSLEAS